MEKLYGRFLVAVAVFCSIVALTSAVAVGDTVCSDGGNQCAGIAHSACDTTALRCKCNAAYKQGTGTADNTCIPKGYGDSCTDNLDCVGDTNSECSTATPKKCVCKTDFTAINNVCKRGLGNLCVDDASCSAVDNAECPDATKKCTCKANYKEDNGQCSTANGLQSLLSAPVALLLSFLTIVVTRLH